MTMLTSPAFRNENGFIFQPVMDPGVYGIDAEGAVSKIADTYQYIWPKGRTFRDQGETRPVALTFMDGDDTVFVDAHGVETRLSGPYRLALVQAIMDAINGTV